MPHSPSRSPRPTGPCHPDPPDQEAQIAYDKGYEEGHAEGYKAAREKKRKEKPEEALV